MPELKTSEDYIREALREIDEDQDGAAAMAQVWASMAVARALLEIRDAITKHTKASTRGWQGGI